MRALVPVHRRPFPHRAPDRAYLPAASAAIVTLSPSRAGPGAARRTLHMRRSGTTPPPATEHAVGRRAPAAIPRLKVYPPAAAVPIHHASPLPGARTGPHLITGDHYTGDLYRRPTARQPRPTLAPLPQRGQLGYGLINAVTRR
jgi:hypothetical protein